MYRYFSTQRPLSMGTFPRPKGNKVIGVTNFGEPIKIAEIGRKAWGYIDYEKPLSAESANRYELLKGGKTE